MTLALNEIEPYLTEKPKPAERPTLSMKTEKTLAKADTVGDAERKGRALLYAAKWPAIAEHDGRSNEGYRHAADLLWDFSLSEADAWDIYHAWNLTNSPAMNDVEERQVFENAKRYGKHPPGAKLVAPVFRPETSNPSDATPVQTPVTICVAQNHMRCVRWLARNHIARGKITILAGMPGSCKSLLTIWIVVAMQQRRGLPAIPPGGPVAIEQGGAVLITCEDDPYDTIAPRVAAYGLDPETVIIYRGTQIMEPDGTKTVAMFDLGMHVEAMDGLVSAYKDVKLLVIDPVQSFMGRSDTNANAAVNQSLGVLAGWAERTGIAVLLVTHFNKKSDQAALDRMIGSRGFSGTVRAAWQVTADPDATGRYILACTKQQNGPRPPAMAFHVRTAPVHIESETEDVPIIDFEPDRIDADPDDLIQQQRKKASRLDECVEWLRERLSAGAVLATTIREEGRQQDFGRDLIYRAKDQIKVKLTTAGFQGKTLWSLPYDENDA